MDDLPKPPTEIDDAIAKNQRLNEGIFNEINKMKNKDALLTALDGSDERKRRQETSINKKASNGGSKRNKKSVRRLVKKRNTKRRKSRRVKH
jgi:hypothetical protein